MHPFFLFTGSGPLVILTSYPSIEDPALLRKLSAKGIDKFIAFTVPLSLAKERYGRHFDHVCQDLKESDDLRVLDYNGQHALHLFHFRELGVPLLHEPATSRW